MDLTPDRIRQLLGLEPHPTCGFVALTYRSRLSIPPSALAAPWALLGSTKWPGVEPADVETGDVAALTRSHPEFAAQIHAFAT